MTIGFLNFNKAPGPTSHDVVATMRRLTGIRQVGHTGTLDPAAAGVLVLAFGKATRLIQYLGNDRKRYKAVIRLGIETDTFDSDGRIISERAIPADLDRSRLEHHLGQFIGMHQQLPPDYSAIKVSGKRAYQLKREGKSVSLQSRPIQIYELSLTRVNFPEIEVEIECSPGTYIRSLAHDMGHALGCGASLSTLTRTANGVFTIENSVDQLTFESLALNEQWQTLLVGPQIALQGIPNILLDDFNLTRLRHGQTVALEVYSGSTIIAYAQNGELAAVLRPGKLPNIWQPEKVF